jgi:transcriptional regulator with XRE-family HTH domain
MSTLTVMKDLDGCLVHIGKKLTRLRVNSGFKSYESFAIQNELSRMQYWRVENGKTNMTMKTLLHLLSIHDIDISDFFSRSFFRNFPLRQVSK